MEFEDPLEEWRELMQPRLAGLQDFLLPEHFPFDYSPESLSQLEAIFLEDYGDDAEPSGDGGDFVQRATGYLGESLLRAGGGSWEWDDGPASDTYDQPLVRPDDALRLPPLSLVDLIAAALRRKTGHEFVRAHTALRDAVVHLQAAHPGWEPTKELTPGVDDILEYMRSEFLEGWLAEREAAFPVWMADCAVGRGIWDFSPESLDTLETVVRRRITSIDEFEDPEHRDFAEGASWYLGEVMRRFGSAEWCYNPGEQDLYDPWVGLPYIKQMIRDGHATVPFLALENVLESRERGLLRARLKRFR